MGVNEAVPPPQKPAAGRLGGASVVFFALAAATPLTIVATVVPGAYAGGLLAVPLVFLGLGLLLLTFAAGYVAMSRRMPHAGALYCFIARGLGRPLGLGAAWLALLAYQALQLGLYAAAGVAVADWLGNGVEWWMVALGCWAAVALCGLLRVTAVAWVLAVLVLAETVVIVGYGAANVLNPADGQLTWATLEPATLTDVSRPVLGAVLVAGVLAFIGFETAAAYAEEARRPRRSIARATYLSIVLLAILYAAASWAMSVATGPELIVAEAGARGPELMFDLAAERLAPWAVTLGRAMAMTGLLAALIALHQTITRYLFALGRERVLPTGRRRTSSLTQTALAGTAIGAGVLADIDPVSAARHLGVAGGLGILVLLLGASLAALMFLNRHPNGESAWSRFFASGLSTVTLGTLAYLAFGDLAALLGVPDDRVLIVPGAAVGALLLGVGYGLALRKARPLAYAGIGLGGAAVIVSPMSPPIPKPRVPGAHRPERISREPSH